MKASIPPTGSDETRLRVAGQLLVQLHLGLGRRVLLIGFLLFLDLVVDGLLLGLLGLLVIPLLLSERIVFLLLEQGAVVVIVLGLVIQRQRDAGPCGHP